MLRVELINNLIGALVIEEADPIGINEIKRMTKRSKDNDGVIHEVIFDLDFIKGGRLFVKRAFEEDGGVDAVVLINIYDYIANSRRWEIYSQGTIDYKKYDVYEDKITVNMEQTGIQRRTLNQLERVIDLETEVSENGNSIPAISTVPAAALHSKTIRKLTSVQPLEFVEVEILDKLTQTIDGLTTAYRERILYGTIDTQKKTSDEIGNSFEQPYGWTDLGTLGITGPASVADTKAWLQTTLGKAVRFEIQRFDEAGIINLLDIKLKEKHRIEAIDPSGDIDVCGDAALGTIELYAWVEIQDINGNTLLLENFGEWDMSGPCQNERIGNFEEKTFTDNDIAVPKGAKLFVFHTVRIYGDYENTDVGNDSVQHNFYITPQEGQFINISIDTTQAASTAKVILPYEAFLQCCRYYTNTLDCFVSELLGRTDLTNPLTGAFYVADGDAAFVSLTNGKNIRAIDSPIFFHLQDLINFFDSLFCIGFGFEKGPDGKVRLRVERRSYFYNKTNKILSLGKVYNVKKSLDITRYYNAFEYGYIGRIDINQVNALDAFNTKRIAEIPVINTKNGLKVGNKFKCDGYQIENQRRLQFSTSTTDGKGDEDPFAIVLVRDGLGYKAKTTEGYTLIENVLSPDTSYNLDISPARCRKNWEKILAASLIYAKSKIVKFSSGEGNFKLRTQKTGETSPIEEDGAIDLTDVEPDYDPFIYTINDVPMRTDEARQIENNGYGYFEFEDQFGEVMEGFVSDQGLEHDPNNGRADLKLLKVYRKPMSA